MAVGRVGRTGDATLDGLFSGLRWLGGAISYGDPAQARDYGSGYRSDLDGDGVSAQRDGFARISPAQMTAARMALDADGIGAKAAHAGFTVEGFTGLRVNYAGSSGGGDLRYGSTTDAKTAYAYQPGEGMGGDVWLGRSGKAPVVGNYDYFALLHETGHALGLKHPHEAGSFGKLPEAMDSVEFSVMSYKTHIGASPTGYSLEKGGAPQSYMMLDIAALQAMYGADFTTNAGDTTYAWRPGSGTTWVNGAAGLAPEVNRIFATIWDGGGEDTYDLSAYASDLRIDLRPGKASVFSAAQLADLGGGPNEGHARGNIFNALLYQGDARSLIENAVGGTGDDSLRGNAAGNCLEGGAGRDVLIGMGGRDLLIGGTGSDVFRFDEGDSTPGAADQLCRGGGAVAFEGPGLGRGDVIDLRDIDANSARTGDQAFVFGGHGQGHLWLEDAGQATWVRGNTDGDAAPEFELAILDRGVRAGAYLAVDFLL